MYKQHVLQAGVTDTILKSKKFKKLLKEFFDENGGVEEVLNKESVYMSSAEIQAQQQNLGLTTKNYIPPVHVSKPPENNDDDTYDEIVADKSRGKTKAPKLPDRIQARPLPVSNCYYYVLRHPVFMSPTTHFFFSDVLCQMFLLLLHNPRIPLP